MSARDPNPLLTGPTEWRADHCTTHHHACDCREWEHACEVERLEAAHAALLAEHNALLARVEGVDKAALGARLALAWAAERNPEMQLAYERCTAAIDAARQPAEKGPT